MYFPERGGGGEEEEERGEIISVRCVKRTG